MACNQNKAPKQRPRSNRFLACFGITSKTASKSDKKRSKTGRESESWFKLCVPKIKIIIIRRKKGKGKGKGSFDAKAVAFKACQSIITYEAAKIQQVKINHALITQEVTNKNTIPVTQSNNCDLQSTRGNNQSEEPASREEQRPIPTVTKCEDDSNKVTKDSLVGVSIMVVTLIIMTFWGYLYAIICISAWLYCVPLLRLYKDGRRPNVMTGQLESQYVKKPSQSKAHLS